jgi:hypothetical protein
VCSRLLVEHPTARLLARACQRLWLFGGYGAFGGSHLLDISFSLTSHHLGAGSGGEHLTEFSLPIKTEVFVSTAFDPTVTSYADVDRLLRTEPQVQLTPFVLNNHSNSFKSHRRASSLSPDRCSSATLLSGPFPPATPPCQRPLRDQERLKDRALSLYVSARVEGASSVLL